MLGPLVIEVGRAVNPMNRALTLARGASLVFAAVLLAACGATGGNVTTTTPTSVVQTLTPTKAPTPKPTPKPTARPTAKPTNPPANTCGAPSNPWGYNFCGGSLIYSPPSTFCDYFTTCIPSFWESTKGYVEECSDGTYSHSGGRSGSCSDHGGNRRPLYS
jgi:hypothetical protein